MRPTPFQGVLDRKKMSEPVRLAYESYCGVKARSKKAGLPPPEMNAREFIGWWLASLQTFGGTRPTCGRIDHSLGYRWDNIEMQDMADNSRESILRNKLNDPTRHKARLEVVCLDPKTSRVAATFPSIRSSARALGVSQRLVQFLVRGKYKSSVAVPYVLRCP